MPRAHPDAFLRGPEPRGTDERSFSRHLVDQLAHVAHELVTRLVAAVLVDSDHREESHGFTSRFAVLTPSADSCLGSGFRLDVERSVTKSTNLENKVRASHEYVSGRSAPQPWVNGSQSGAAEPNEPNRVLAEAFVSPGITHAGAQQRSRARRSAYQDNIR